MTTPIDLLGRMTRAQLAALPLSADVAQALAEQHGVCIRPLAMRRINTTTGRIDIVPVPCGSTQSPPATDGPVPPGLAPRHRTGHPAGHTQ